MNCPPNALMAGATREWFSALVDSPPMLYLIAGSIGPLAFGAVSLFNRFCVAAGGEINRSPKNERDPATSRSSLAQKEQGSILRPALRCKTSMK